MKTLIENVLGLLYALYFACVIGSTYRLLENSSDATRAIIGLVAAIVALAMIEGGVKLKDRYIEKISVGRHWFGYGSRIQIVCSYMLGIVTMLAVFFDPSGIVPGLVALSALLYISLKVPRKHQVFMLVPISILAAAFVVPEDTAMFSTGPREAESLADLTNLVTVRNQLAFLAIAFAVVIFKIRVPKFAKTTGAVLALLVASSIGFFIELAWLARKVQLEHGIHAGNPYADEWYPNLLPFVTDYKLMLSVGLVTGLSFGAPLALRYSWQLAGTGSLADNVIESAIDANVKIITAIIVLLTFLRAITIPLGPVSLLATIIGFVFARKELPLLEWANETLLGDSDS